MKQPSPICMAANRVTKQCLSEVDRTLAHICNRGTLGTCRPCSTLPGLNNLHMSDLGESEFPGL